MHQQARARRHERRRRFQRDRRTCSKARATNASAPPCASPAPPPDPITGMSKVDRDIADAKAVAERSGIPHHVLDLQQTFDRNVIERFVNAYQEGLTPNPCIICNRHIKFGALLDGGAGHGLATTSQRDITPKQARRQTAPGSYIAAKIPKRTRATFCIRLRRSAWRTRSFRWRA